MNADGQRWESVAERRIREAMERGDFDDLPGAGRPLPDAGTPYRETWWVERWVQRERLGGAADPAEPADGDSGSLGPS